VVAMEVTRPASRLPGPTPPAEPRQTPRTRLRPQIRGCRQFKVLPTTRHSRQPDCPERDRTGRRRSSSRRGLAALLLAKPTGRQHASVFRSSGGDDHRWLETRRRRGKSITTTDFGAGCARDHESLRSIECERRLSSLVFCFDAFSSREPVPTPYPVRGRLSLENAVLVRRRRPTHELARDMRRRECSQLRFYPRSSDIGCLIGCLHVRHSLRGGTPQEDSHSQLTNCRFGSRSSHCNAPGG
jgi:hypothetical protein